MAEDSDSLVVSDGGIAVGMNFYSKNEENNF